MATKYVIGGAPAGAADGSSPANCWGSIQNFFDSTSVADTCLCYGSETLAATATVKSSGTDRGAMNRVIGCDVNWTPCAAVYTINANGQTSGINLGTYDVWRLCSLRIHNCTGAAILCGAVCADHSIDHCILEPGTHGIDGDFDGCVIYNNIIKNGSGNGINNDGGGNVIILWNLIYGFSDYGMYLNGQSTVFGNIVRNNTDGNIYSLSAGIIMAFNVAHQSGSGFGLKGATTYNHFYFNAITSNATYGIDSPVANSLSDFNGFRSNGTADYNLCAAGPSDFTFAADPYEDEANENFTLKPRALNRRRELAIEAPNYFYPPAGFIPNDRPGGLYPNN